MTLQELFTDESKWTKGASARNEEGVLCPPHFSEARSWCLMGAINLCCRHDFDERKATIHALKNAITGGRPNDLSTAIQEKNTPNEVVEISRFNDSPETTFADIRKVIEEANV